MPALHNPQNWKLDAANLANERVEWMPEVPATQQPTIRSAASELLTCWRLTRVQLTPWLNVPQYTKVYVSAIPRPCPAHLIPLITTNQP